MPDEIKQDIEKVAGAARSAEGQLDAATERALGAVNRQASWIEQHPKLSLGIAAALLVLLIVLAVKAF